MPFLLQDALNVMSEQSNNLSPFFFLDLGGSARSLTRCIMLGMQGCAAHQAETLALAFGSANIFTSLREGRCTAGCLRAELRQNGTDSQRQGSIGGGNAGLRTPRMQCLRSNNWRRTTVLLARRWR